MGLRGGDVDVGGEDVRGYKEGERERVGEWI